MDTQIEPIPDDILYSYQQYSNNDFPQYNQKLVFILNNYIVLNANKVYRILDNDNVSKSFYRIYDLSYLYDNKVALQEDLMVFKDDLATKVSTMVVEDSAYDFSSKLNEIENVFTETMKFKKLYYSILHYIKNLKIELKDLEDNSNILTVSDSRKRTSIKQKTRNKMKSLERLAKDVMKTLFTNYNRFLQKLLTYMYFRNKIKKEMISLQSSEKAFEDQFNVNVLSTT
jgi:protein tyrosine/serine phosphatase